MILVLQYWLRPVCSGVFQSGGRRRLSSGLSIVRTGFGVSYAFSFTTGVLWGGFHAVSRATLLVDSADSNSAHLGTRSYVS